MKLLVTTALVSAMSLGLVGASTAMADGTTSVRAGVSAQVTRELSTQTSKQVSGAASQATRESQTR